MAAAALQMPSLPRDIHSAAFMPMPHTRNFPKLQQPKPKLAIPPATTMKRPIEAKTSSAEVVSKTAASHALPMTPKRRRKSVSESIGSATEVPTKRRRTIKDSKPAQSPEKSGEEQEGPTRESYPDPRWMNEPRKYLNLRDHRYKYISKITNKLLDDEGWKQPAKEYQEMQQKKTGTWMSLNQHLYPKNKDCIPPSVNPLELVLDLILKHGAATPEDRNQEPSISGCFLRLVNNLVANESLAKIIEIETADTLASRERTGLDEAAAQPASPVVSATFGNQEELKSPNEPASPALSGLDDKTGPQPQSPMTSPNTSRTFHKDQKVRASPSISTTTPLSGSGSSQQYGPLPLIPAGFSGSATAAAQSMYGFTTGFPGPLPAYGPTTGLGLTNQNFVDASTSPILANSPHSATGLPFYGPHPRYVPRTQSPLAYAQHSRMIGPQPAPATTSFMQQPWTMNAQSAFSSQDPGTSIETESLVQSLGHSQPESVTSEYSTPKEQVTGFNFYSAAAVAQAQAHGLDIGSMNSMILDEARFDAWLNFPWTTD
ncbi:hypothetical protein TWF173_009692 [Orbilia oligospora]|uniref:Uncharacterized protein n=1 Tax=Arthrobotrys oligospora (strain ATCC 24927 / CBS 115.81 / DSM 1491) TaxID=756982 RepID=G1X1W1_ARTOA|nr:hypothetical protein AOL_s00007g270 [Orbilia oligospora ATCC 24927]EGX52934.1 hypothetical protein AOL_s00007g270 [Orbilia oligospora ATCC 24927]KAF3317871.1 hypothetical protein TWF173_009692 [Orbilia oligospora]